MNALWPERRLAPRRAIASTAGRLSFRPPAGPTLEVVDVSPGGARVESGGALTPGARLTLRPVGVDRSNAPLPVLVVYCRVTALSGGGGLRFQAGLQIEPGRHYPHAFVTVAGGQELPALRAPGTHVAGINDSTSRRRSCVSVID